ncbi:MAG: type III pantothenate kinase [Candidatus Aminicenantes bacterium]|nr:type III pantothenate kinase [Candidatus Aminicenantes bacterium]
MLLALDIGNTTVAIGLFKDKTLAHHWRVRSDRDKTGDEYGIILRNLLASAGLDPAAVKAVIVSSVVPPLTPIFQTLSHDLFRLKALVVGPGLRTGMPILYEAPLEVGADRVVAAVAAYEKIGGPCIVLDFGTATTFDAVSAKGEYLGGAIAPGIQISAEALYLKTAKLPRIEIKKPAKAVGKTTVASMQSGLYFGYVGLVRNIIGEIRKELGEEAKVIATGGFGDQISAELKTITAYEPNLVLEGLRIIYERNR